MRARSPETCDRRADGRVLLAGVLVDVAGVGDLAFCRRVDAVDFRAREAAETGDAKLFGNGVDARVLEELVARVVDLGDRGVVFQDALARELAREVLAGVEVFEEAAGGVEVFGGELDLARLRGQRSGNDARGRG
jgi:hypothetical protein